MFDLPAYPGRGIAVHLHHDGRLEWLYFLTGRSEASRARTLQATADRVTVVPIGDGEHDPLRHYSCVRVVGSIFVVGNGDHVDAIADAFVARGHGHDVDEDDVAATLREATGDIEAEPDPPINTPRIALVARAGAPAWQGDGTLIDVFTAVHGADGAVRSTHTLEVEVGHGVIVHTYGGDTTDVTVDAEPHRFDAGGPGTDVAGRLWHALDPGLRVAVAVGLVPDAVPTRVLAERRIEPPDPT